jgi:hypothetical protein
MHVGGGRTHASAPEVLRCGDLSLCSDFGCQDSGVADAGVAAGVKQFGAGETGRFEFLEEGTALLRAGDSGKPACRVAPLGFGRLTGRRASADGESAARYRRRV